MRPVLALLCAIALGACPDDAPPTLVLDPAEVTLGPAATQQFTAVFSRGEPAPLEWLVDHVVGGTTGTGTVTNAGLYTAPADVGSLTQVIVTARVAARPDEAGAALVRFDATGPSLTITTTGPTVPVGASFAFQTGSIGIDPARLTWTLETSPPRLDVGTIDPTTGVYQAPDLLPDPPVALIEAVVTLTGSSLQARASLRIQALRFDPPDVELLDAGATATFDVLEDLSDGTSSSLLGQTRLGLTLDNPVPACATLAGDTVTALDPTGVAMVFAEDASTGAETALRVHNRGRPSLFVDDDELVHGVPGFDRPLAVELRIARTPLAAGGPDIADDPRLVFEALDASGAVSDGAEPGAPDALVAWIDTSGPRVVYGGTPGVATFRVTHPTFEATTTFDVELLATWLRGYSRGPGTSLQLFEVGQVPTGHAAPWTGSDVSLVTSHLSGEVQTLVAMLWGEAPDDPRWSLLSTDDLGVGRAIVWEVLEGHGHFLGPELIEASPLLTAPDQATGVYEDGPLAGQAWARRALSDDTLLRLRQSTSPTTQTWKGQRGSFVRFVATRPGPVVIEARLDGSDLPPVRWDLDCKLPLLSPTGVTALYVGSTAWLRLTQVRDPALPFSAESPWRWAPPRRVEVARPSGELVLAEEMLFYTQHPAIQDRAYVYLDEPGTWSLRLVYDADGIDAPTPWFTFEVASVEAIPHTEGFASLVIVDQSDAPFVPGQTVVTLQALGSDGPVATSLSVNAHGLTTIHGARFANNWADPSGYFQIAGVSVNPGAAPPLGAGLRGRWWPIGPYYVNSDLSPGQMYPALGSSTLQVILELDPESDWHEQYIAPAWPRSTTAGFGQFVYFDPPAILPPLAACVTPTATGHETVLRLTGSAALDAVMDDLTVASVTVDRAWVSVTGITRVGHGQLDLRLGIDLAAAGAEAFGADPHTLRVTSARGTFEAPFRLYRVRLSGWQPDRAAAAQTDDDDAVGLPLNARFRGPDGRYREGVMPAEVHVEGHAPGVALRLGTRSGAGDVRTALSRDDHEPGEDGVVEHAPLTDAPFTLRALAVAGAPSSYPVLVYGDLTDLADNDSGAHGAPDGLPDAVSEAPDDETLWVSCDGREADVLPFTAFAYRAVPVGDLRAPATALGAPTAAGAAGYAAENTFAGAPATADALEVRVDVDHAAADRISASGLAHAPDRDGRARLFDGAHLTPTHHDALPDWMEGTGGAAGWGVELDGLCFDPEIELLPTTDVAANDPALFPPDRTPTFGPLGFLDGEGGASGGVVGTHGEGWGRYWLVAETPGSRWPGLDCAHPYAGTRASIAAADDDLEDVALFADGSGAVDLESAQVAALAEGLDRPDGVTAGVQISGARFGYVWTTTPEASPGVPILAADLVGTLLVGEAPRFRPVAPGEPGWHPDGTWPGVDDDLVVTARRYTGAGGEARLIGLRIATDTIVGGLAAATFAVLFPAAITTTPFWYAAGQGGVAMVTSYVSEFNGLSTSESVVVGKLGGKAGGKVGSRAVTRASLWGLRIFGANLGTKNVATSVGIGFADEAASLLGTALSEGIKRTSLTDGDGVSATAEATMAETLTVRVPDECVSGDDGGARVAMIHSAKTLSVESRADFRKEPAGALLPVWADGGQTQSYVERCASLAGAPMLVMSPGAPLGELTGPAIPGLLDGPEALADFKIVVRGQAGEVWGLTRSATAVATRSNPAGTARVRLRADGALFFAAYGLEVDAIRR